MVLRRRPIVVCALVALLALVVGVVGAVSASPDGDKDRNKAHTTLKVLAKDREARIVDLGPRGPSHGDMRVVNGPLYNASGTEKVGRLDLFCVLTAPQMSLGRRPRRRSARTPLPCPAERSAHRA